ncbi:hypothetical protein GQ457_05G002130 [Hibiscus cannabinus]
MDPLIYLIFLAELHLSQTYRRKVAFVIDSCRSLQVFWDSGRRKDSMELVWVSKSQDKHRLEHLKRVLEFEEMEPATLLLPKLEEEWCSFHHLVQSSLHHVSEMPALYQRHAVYRNYSNAALQHSTVRACGATSDLSMVPSTASAVCIQAPAEKGFTSFAIDFLMGGVSAAVSKTAAAPIERVKLLIQNQDEMIKTGRLAEPYKGVGDCFKRTIQDEGFVSLWRGNTANVIRGAAGASSLLFVYSLDYARTRLANDAKAAKKGGERQFNGLVDVYRKTLKSDAGALQDSFFASFSLGWLITNGAGLAPYPIDTVRRRMMMTSGEVVKYNSSLDAFSQILKNEGAKSLLKSVGANILRVIAAAGVLAGYDKLQLICVRNEVWTGWCLILWVYFPFSPV